MGTKKKWGLNPEMGCGKNDPQTKGGVWDLKSTFERCEGLVWVQNNVPDSRFPSQVMSLAPAN